MDNSGKTNLVARIADGVTMFVVMWLSLLLLIYVALGEGSRIYERFQGDKLAGQVQIVQNTMHTFLRSGLPLKQFVGFTTIAEPILSADETISTLSVSDPDGKQVFFAGDAEVGQKIANFTEKSAQAGNQSNPNDVVITSRGFTMLKIAGHYRITVPLRDKFEIVGRLVITMPQSVVSDKVSSLFDPLLLYSPMPAVIFALFIALFGPWMQNRRLPWAQITFASIFLAASVGIILTLVSLYSDGAQAKARALASTLGQRLSDIVAFDINLSEITGLDHTFGEYLEVHPDLSAAALTQDGKILIHTDKTMIGKNWVSNTDNYTYVVSLTPEDSPRRVEVAVEVPSEIVLERVLRSVKNFAALFIASAFLATLFFQVGGTVRSSTEFVSKSYSKDAAPSGRMHDRLLDFVKPVFFLGVLAEHMTYAFLPQYIKQAAAASGVAETYATAPFFGFYAAFALTLIPAGYVAQRIGARPLMYIGLLLAGAGVAAITMTSNFWVIAAARAFSGVGQGMLFIGIQSYLLSVASPQRKTQAAAIIVYGFQGGMISGMAVGSLLVSSMGTQGVFTLSAIIAIVAAVYCLIAVPSVDVRDTETAAQNRDLLRGLGQAIRSIQFLNTMVTIGVPAKAVLTGVITFGLPLLLAQSEFAQEDIGQIIMIYAISVVVASKFIAPRVDRLGTARNILFQGTLISAVGLGLIAYGGSNTLNLAANAIVNPTIILLAGIALVGIAHGFINAPVITHIADSHLAARIGATTATATYRFAERAGHIMGPVIMGALFILFRDDWAAIGFAAVAIVLLGVLFIATSSDGPTTQSDRDTQNLGLKAKPAV
jgi:predicted MFS family arabinose efflux permease